MRQVSWRWLAPHALTPQQYTVLMVLSEKPGLSLRQVAELVWVDSPTACRILKNLEDRSFVVATPDRGHGRRLKLTLSPAGLALAASLRQLRKTLIEGIEAGLTEDECHQLRRTLRRMMSNLAQMEAEGFLDGLLPALSGPRGD